MHIGKVDSCQAYHHHHILMFYISSSIFFMYYSGWLTFVLNMLRTDLKRPPQGKKTNIQMLSNFLKPAYSIFKLGFQLKNKNQQKF